VAGNSTPGDVDNADGLMARFGSPAALATDGTTLWVADGGNRKLKAVDVTDAPGVPGGELKFNEPLRADVTMSLPTDQPLSNPYWLAEPHGKGLYTVADPALIGKPEAPPPFVARFRRGFRPD
jgi:hypothetical protein